MVLGRLRAVELHLRLDGVISGSDHTDAFPPTAPLAERLRSLLLLPGSPTHMHRKSGRLLMACIRCGQGGISAFVRTACNGLLVGLQLCENVLHLIVSQSRSLPAQSVSCMKRRRKSLVDFAAR